MWTFFSFSLIALSLLASFEVVASTSDTGTITRIRGDVEILSQVNQAKTTQVYYQDRSYFLTQAQLGDEIRRGDILRTGHASIVRVVFENGDQFTVGPGSEYTLEIQAEGQSSSLINMARGRLRGVVSSDGPRNNMEVKTRSASLGIRGTDFFVESPRFSQTEVTVIRGEVEIAAIDEKSSRPSEVIAVRSGQSGEIKSTDSFQPPLIVPTSQRRLISIQESTNIKRDEKKDLPPQLNQRIQILEQAALETTKKDIKRHDPKLYEKLQRDPDRLKSVDDLQGVVTALAIEKAPVDEKLSPQELKKLRNNPYREYLRP